MVPPRGLMAAGLQRNPCYVALACMFFRKRAKR